MTHARTMLLALSFGVSGVVPQALGAQRRSQGRPIELGVDATLAYDFGLLFHFSPDRTQSQTYIRPFVGLRGFSGDDDSGSQGSFGLGLGVKKPIVNRLAGRFEVGFAHATDDNDFPASNQVFFAFGLSFFTR